MSENIEFWEAAVDEILSDHNISVTPEVISKLAIDFSNASSAVGDSMAPVQMAETIVKVVTITPKTLCCDAEVEYRTTGLLNGGYSVCARCEVNVNVTAA